MAPLKRAKSAIRTGRNVRNELSELGGTSYGEGQALGQAFLEDPGAVRQQSRFLFLVLLTMQLLGRALAAPFRAIDRAISMASPATRDRGQAGMFGVIGLLIVLLVAGIVLILGPTILALLTTSLPTTANTEWNSTYTSVQGNVDTAFTIGGVLLVIVVIGAMITVLLSSFTGGMRGGGGGLM